MIKKKDKMHDKTFEKKGRKKVRSMKGIYYWVVIFCSPSKNFKNNVILF